jgi:hypothetical protein
MVKPLNEPSASLSVKLDKVYMVHELVCISHLCNCMVCHAPSVARDDLVRGRLPVLASAVVRCTPWYTRLWIAGVMLATVFWAGVL